MNNSYLRTQYILAFNFDASITFRQYNYRLQIMLLFEGTICPPNTETSFIDFFVWCEKGIKMRLKSSDKIFIISFGEHGN